MLKARKKNRVVRIPETSAAEYKSLGYTLVDETGLVVYEPEDKDATIATLRKENAMLKQEIEEYKLLLKATAPKEKTKTDKAKT